MQKQYNSRTTKFIIASGVVGGLLETFDVMLCAFFAQFIAVAFLPPQHSQKNYLFSIFNIFLIGFLSKPIGSLLIGLHADQAGRKNMLIFSIFMISLCTALIGIVPSYASIGMFSSFLFLCLRILQNVSVGGEYIASITYLIESADKNSRGFFGSWISVGLCSGILLASLFACVWIYYIDMHLIPEWSWRLLFIAAALGMSIGIWIRSSLPESKEFICKNSTNTTQTKGNILKETIHFLKKYPHLCLASMSITCLGVCETAAVFIYSPIHMATINHLSPHASLGINTLSLVLLITLIPIFGILSDYYGQIKLLALSSIAFIILAIPYFWYLSYGGFGQILFFTLLLAVPSACFYATAPVLITQIFPLHLRCTSLALIYQTAASVCSGVSPIIIFYMVYYDHMRLPYSPAYFLIGLSLFCLMGLYYINKMQYIDFTSVNIEKIMATGNNVS